MEEWTIDEVKDAIINEPVVGIYFYTPMCGTCQVTKKILNVVEVLLPHLKIGMYNLNYGRELAEVYQIESVPCLLLVKEGKVQKQIYAFQSVEYIYEECQKLDEDDATVISKGE